MVSFFFKNINCSSLITPKIFAFNFGYFLVISFNLVLINGQLSSTRISNNLILLSANGILSRAPGASNFRCIDFAISNSGEITKSIGTFCKLNNDENLGSKYS